MTTKREAVEAALEAVFGKGCNLDPETPTARVAAMVWDAARGGATETEIGPELGKCRVCGGDPDDRHDGPGHSARAPRLRGRRDALSRAAGEAMTAHEIERLVHAVILASSREEQAAARDALLAAARALVAEVEAEKRKGSDVTFLRAVNAEMKLASAQEAMRALVASEFCRTANGDPMVKADAFERVRHLSTPLPTEEEEK